jgi:TatA/E family protein of Tat protein translocase
MFGHLPELFIVLLLALIVFGPEKLPEVAANAGKMMREVREVVQDAMNPLDTEVPEDFTTYYQESLARSGEEIPVVEDDEYLHEIDPEEDELRAVELHHVDVREVDGPAAEHAPRPDQATDSSGSSAIPKADEHT